jgi:hypothetical protein
MVYSEILDDSEKKCAGANTLAYFAQPSVISVRQNKLEFLSLTSFTKANVKIIAKESRSTIECFNTRCSLRQG